MAGEKLIVDNRRARHDYELLERFEAGLVLTGTEVKSLRQGRVSLGQAFGDLRDGEVWLVGAEIATYDQGNIANHEPARDRKLLLRRGEIASLRRQGAREGPDPRADADVLEERPREGRARARPRQADDRQAPGHRQARGRPADAARAEGSAIARYTEANNIRGRPGLDVVGSPAELQVEVPGRPR